MGIFLETSIERRISAWQKIQERQSQNREECKLPTITISRRFGCEAYPVAQKLQKLLKLKTGKDWIIFDRALLEIVSKKENLDKHSLEKVGDLSHGLDFFATFLPSVKTHDELFNSIAVTIKEIANRGGAIIVGRGSSILTNDIPNCFHFRLDAPFKFRVESIMSRNNKSKKEAEEFVQNNQEYRDEFLNHFFDVDINDIKYYDMIFNNSKLSADNISEQIVWVMEPSLQKLTRKVA
jgi:cytidylate kinase